VKIVYLALLLQSLFGLGLGCVLDIQNRIGGKINSLNFYINSLWVICLMENNCLRISKVLLLF